MGKIYVFLFKKIFFSKQLFVFKKVVFLQHLSNHDVERVTGPSSAVLAFYIFLIFFEFLLQSMIVFNIKGCP